MVTVCANWPDDLRVLFSEKEWAAESVSQSQRGKWADLPGTAAAFAMGLWPSSGGSGGRQRAEGRGPGTLVWPSPAWADLGLAGGRHTPTYKRKLTEAITVAAATSAEGRWAPGKGGHLGQVTGPEGALRARPAGLHLSGQKLTRMLSGTVRPFACSIPFDLTRSLGHMFHSALHFGDEETEAQKCQLTWSDAGAEMPVQCGGRGWGSKSGGDLIPTTGAKQGCGDGWDAPGAANRPIGRGRGPPGVCPQQGFPHASPGC